MSDAGDPERAFLDRVGVLGPALLGVLYGLEVAARRLHPPAIAELRESLRPLRERLDEARARFSEREPPAGLEPLARRLTQASDHAARAAALFVDAGAVSEAIARVLGAMHEHCRAQETTFPLRAVFPSIDQYFVEPAFADRLSPPGPEVADDVGLFNAGNEPGARGGFTLFVPESYDGNSEWPLVVALHGGHGHGADFLWTWLREARGRRFLLLAPTSRGATWSFDDPTLDGGAIRSMIDHVGGRWRVDRTRVLLTGLSDGATFTLLAGLAQDAPFTALAPVSGVLHPLNFVLGNLERAHGRRIHLVHGALDWMFPVALANEAAGVLRDAGADVHYREIADLSHTYPREENGPILEWFDPTLAG